MQNDKKKVVVMDLDAIMEFIFAPEEKRSSEVQLEETFMPLDEANPSSKLSLMERVRRERKNDEHDQHEAIRLQFIARLLDAVDQIDVEDGVLGTENEFGEEVAYNTLFNYGFLKAV